MKKSIALAAVLVLLAVAAYGLLNTRLGVHLVLDVISEIGSAPEVQTSAADGPLLLTAQIAPVEKRVLPDFIEQPSGIKHRNGMVYIVTDQSEVFTLDADFKNASKAFYLLEGPLLFKQGALEGVAVRGDRLYGVGEFGAVACWVEEEGHRWTRISDVVLPAAMAETEFSGITDSPTGWLATSENHQSIIHLNDGSTEALSCQAFLKENADLGSLVFSGLAYAKGHLYILSESHTAILVVDAATYELKFVFGIEACAAADISMHEGRAYIVIDHNYNESPEPIQVYDVDAAMKAVASTGSSI